MKKKKLTTYTIIFKKKTVKREYINQSTIPKHKTCQREAKIIQGKTNLQAQ
jgi:hypothetical protein